MEIKRHTGFNCVTPETPAGKTANYIIGAIILFSCLSICYNYMVNQDKEKNALNDRIHNMEEVIRENHYQQIRRREMMRNEEAMQWMMGNR